MPLSRYVLLSIYFIYLTSHERATAFAFAVTPRSLRARQALRTNPPSCSSRNRHVRGEDRRRTVLHGMSDVGADEEGSFGAKAMQERTREELQSLISEHNIIAFIKGTRLMPQCGFSGTLVNILQSLSVSFETVDVLADDRIRQGIKDFSDWPTIPQLYLGGEFVGGSDIVIELYQSGELQEMIEVAAAS